ncbi:MAG: hypothetical protein JXA28_01420 [Bacteroidetes bacterium]|nr:hypothetical protein [Bacteroidota bacterium]
MPIVLLLLLFPLLSLSFSAAPQSGNEPRRSFRASDGASIDAIVTALYESVSGRAGEEKDWSRWWIVSVLWDEERQSSPIPPEYLPQSD